MSIGAASDPYATAKPPYLVSRTVSVCLPAMRSSRLASALDFVLLRNNHDNTRRRSGLRQGAFRGVSILGTSRGRAAQARVMQERCAPVSSATIGLASLAIAR